MINPDGYLDPSSAGGAGPGIAPYPAPVVSPALLPHRRREPDSRWYVLHTRSRQEKALETSLHAAGIGCHLPLRRAPRRYGARRGELLVPMFPGYLFLWGARDDVFFADRTRRVAGIIEVTDQATLEWELAGLHRAFVAGAALDPYEALHQGMRVRVVSGPFEGLEGVVASRSSPERLVLQVRMLSTAASLDIDGEQVEPIEA
jgi:transcription antitermination factor NusG